MWIKDLSTAGTRHPIPGKAIGSRQSARSTMEIPGSGTTNFPPSAK